MSTLGELKQALKSHLPQRIRFKIVDNHPHVRCVTIYCRDPSKRISHTKLVHMVNNITYSIRPAGILIVVHHMTEAIEFQFAVENGD